MAPYISSSCVDAFEQLPAPPTAPFTTVMNWQSYEPLKSNGTTFGHKNIEFPKFFELPRKAKAKFIIAVSGKEVPTQKLTELGWHLEDAHQVTVSYDSFRRFIRDSKGEFGVCKNGFVATSSGWFSDRSAAYLASGRPVVLQDTGFSSHLPCGEGLFAVNSADDAAAAVEKINSDYETHSRRARAIAFEYLDSVKVLGSMLNDLGV